MVLEYKNVPKRIDKNQLLPTSSHKTLGVKWLIKRSFWHQGS
jgi:hypothetical protein